MRQTEAMHVVRKTEAMEAKTEASLRSSGGEEKEMGSQRSDLQDERPLWRSFDLEFKGYVVKEGYAKALKCRPQIEFRA